MTEHPFPAIAPPADGLSRAFGEARRRRTRSAAATTSASALAGLVLLGAVAQPGGTRLVQEPAPPASAVDATVEGGVLRPDADQRAPRPATSADVAAVVTVPGALPAAAALSPGRSGYAGTTPGAAQQSRSGSGTVTTASKSGDRAMVSRRTGAVYGEEPNDLGWCVSRAASRLCSWGTGYDDGRRHFLQLSICNPTASPQVLRFTHEEEARFAVYRGKELLWVSAPDTGAEEPHRLWVDAGTCTRWNVEWSGRDHKGRAITGTLGLRAVVQSEDAGDARQSQSSYTGYEARD